MPLRYLLDEDSLGPLWTAFQRLGIRGAVRLDISAVNEPGAPPTSTKDPALLLWLEEHGRLLITNDKRTMPVHLSDHLASGRHVPGIFAIRRGASIPDVVEFAVLASELDEPNEWTDRITYVP